MSRGELSNKVSRYDDAMMSAAMRTRLRSERKVNVRRWAGASGNGETESETIARQ